VDDRDAFAGVRVDPRNVAAGATIDKTKYRPRRSIVATEVLNLVL